MSSFSRFRRVCVFLGYFLGRIFSGGMLGFFVRLEFFRVEVVVGARREC